MAPMIPELDSAIGRGLAILLADEPLSQEAEVDCSIDFVDKNRQLVERYRWTDAASIYAAYRRALKNYRYFHFIGVFRRHYRAFTRRSGYDVW